VTGPDAPPSPITPLRRIVITALVVQGLWLVGMTAGDRWHLFIEGWFMSVTMAVGSFIAGATAEGGGAVAFPVMTLLFKIPPPVARDFALMIQSVGMGSASLLILGSGIPIVRSAVVWGGLGGAVGVVVGIAVVAPLLPPPFAKMGFLAVWLAFAVALALMDRRPGRARHSTLDVGPREAVTLALTGVVGGVVSGISGSGLDIVVFSLLVLRYGVSETVATPTSVVLMASNAMFGFFWKSTLGGGMAPEAFRFWWVCVPIVVVGAPVGAWFIRDRSPRFVARLLMASIALQFIGGVVIIPQTTTLFAFTVVVWVIAAGLFALMARVGVSASARDPAAASSAAPSSRSG
jgi:uncharacterized membrane protein YfcA